MTNDEIQELAYKAEENIEPNKGGTDYHWAFCTEFAKLVAAAERAACAKLCEEFELAAIKQWDRTADPEAQGKEMAAADCAAAIRARGNDGH